MSHVSNTAHRHPASGAGRIDRCWRRVTISLVGPALVVLFSQAADYAATITYVGSVEGPEVVDWRTSTTPKTLDIDGNNIYGDGGSGSTIGAAHWNVANTNEQLPGSPTLGWAMVAESGIALTDITYVAIDHITNAPADTTAGLHSSDFTFELTGVAADYLGRTVRIGVMEDIFLGVEKNKDRFKGLQIVQTLGGSADSGVLALRGGNLGNSVPDFYFWDISNATAGDQFKIAALADVGETSSQVGYMGSITWDISPAPEPCGAHLATIAGMLGAALVRRRPRGNTRVARSIRRNERT